MDDRDLMGRPCSVVHARDGVRGDVVSASQDEVELLEPVIFGVYRACLSARVMQTSTCGVARPIGEWGK